MSSFDDCVSLWCAIGRLTHGSYVKRECLTSSPSLIGFPLSPFEPLPPSSSVRIRLHLRRRFRREPPASGRDPVEFEDRQIELGLVHPLPFHRHVVDVDGVVAVAGDQIVDAAGLALDELVLAVADKGLDVDLLAPRDLVLVAIDDRERAPPSPGRRSRRGSPVPGSAPCPRAR